MTLIKSISGIRGTIGGPVGEGLTPVDIVKFSYAYCEMLRKRLRLGEDHRYTVVVGRDARISGEMVENLVCGTLSACGVDVIKAGFASTPTTEMAVTMSGADGGIIITASHNPKQWNALKLLNERGEFLNAEEGQAILDCAERGDFDFSDVEALGDIVEEDFTDRHIDAVLSLDEVDVEAVRKAGFKVVLDAVNSVGGIIMPRLLGRMGVECVELNCNPDGQFAHNPEPLPANLVELGETVVREKADLGISVDPDVDRLAFFCEDGCPFVEEYTLVSVADYLLGRICDEAGKTGGSAGDLSSPYSFTTVSNLSSSRALRDVTEKYGGKYYASAVGEVNVTSMMKECRALVGGEGNGGVIFPALHYGRDAMVGVALFLSNLARKGIAASALKASYPQYHISKNKIQLSDKSMIDKILAEMQKIYASEDINTVDGVKITFEKERSWVHLRKSNTEPIIRVYAEAPDEAGAEKLASDIVRIAEKIIS